MLKLNLNHANVDQSSQGIYIYSRMLEGLVSGPLLVASHFCSCCLRFQPSSRRQSSRCNLILRPLIYLMSPYSLIVTGKDFCVVFAFVDDALAVALASLKSHIHI